MSILHIFIILIILLPLDLLDHLGLDHIGPHLDHHLDHHIDHRDGEWTQTLAGLIPSLALQQHRLALQRQKREQVIIVSIIFIIIIIIGIIILMMI